MDTLSEKAAALHAFVDRLALYKNQEHIANWKLPAGSPMYFYCKGCDKPIVVPEAWLEKPDHCLDCRYLIIKGWMPDAG